MTEIKLPDPSVGFDLDNTDPVSWYNHFKTQEIRDIFKEFGLTEEDGDVWLLQDGTDAGYWTDGFIVTTDKFRSIKRGCKYSPFQLLVILKFHGDYRSAFEWVISKYFSEDIPYIRVGVDYYKIISKIDRYGINRTELKAWTLESIKLDHGKSYSSKIPHFDDFTIQPDNFNYQHIVNNCYNLYREFSHKPIPDDWPWTEILLQHIFGEQYHIGIRYLQILYLHPDRLMPILVLVSRQRQTGKTTFLNWLNMIFGDNVANISPEDLVNGFNAPYAAANIVAIEETLIEKTHTIEKLKANATAKFITVNQKYVSQYRLPFFGKFILTSNNEDKFARIDQEEIRFFIRKVNIPTISNHSIEKDLITEIPAFLHHLTTLPPVNFSMDRSGFTPDELNNDCLVNVKQESRSENCKELIILLEDIFLNEARNETEFYVDAKSIKERFFSRDNRTGVDWIRKILQRELNLIPTEKPIYFTPFTLDNPKTARAYLIKRDMFKDAQELNPDHNQKEELPF